MIQKYGIFSFLFFLLISFFIVFPLLSPGYILTLDILATDKILLPAWTNINFLFTGLLYMLNFFMPTYLLQKILLFLILFLSGFGMYRLAIGQSRLVKLFAGLLYMINPFIYERLVSGQWSYALGYAVFPWVVSASVNYFQASTILRIIILALGLTILANLSLHFFIIFCLFYIIFFIVWMFFHTDKITKILPATGGLLILSVLLNLNWIIGFATSLGSLSAGLSAVNYEDLISFQSFADPVYGLVFNLLSGYGFWGEANNYFISPKSIFPFWPAITVIVIGIAAYGFYIFTFKKKQLPVGITLGILFLLALDLAIGVASKNFEQITILLYDKFIFLRVFREPQKFIAIIYFCYAYFGSIGLNALLAKIRNKYRFVLLIAVFIIPFVLAPTVFGGFWGQFKPVFYPQSWNEVNAMISKDKDVFLVLFLPWHQYMKFGFNNDRVVANPAPYYFDKPIISSQNYETVSLYTHDTRTEALHIEGLLGIERERKNLMGEKVEDKVSWGVNLSPINVKYIILAKEDDWRDYIFLYTTPDIKKIYEGNEIILFKNNRWSLTNSEEIEPLEEYTKEEIKNLEKNQSRL